MRKLRFSFVVVGLVLLAALAFFAVVPNTGNAEKQHVRIATFSRAVDYAPYIVAKKKGWFDEAAGRHGLSVEYRVFESLPAINEALATGNLDVVFEAEPPAIVGRAAGIEVRIRGMGVSLVQEVLVHPDAGIDSVSKLRGRKIAVAAGSSSHYGIVKALEVNGLTRADVQLIDMTPPDARVAFEKKQIDAWAVWPPWVEQQEEEGNGIALRGGDVFIYSIVAMRQDFASQNPGLAEEILGVVDMAKEWISLNEREAQAMVAEELGLPISVVERAWSKHDFRAALGEKEAKDIQAKADFLFESGLVKRRLNVFTELVEVEGLEAP